MVQRNYIIKYFIHNIYIFPILSSVSSIIIFVSKTIHLTSNLPVHAATRGDLFDDELNMVDVC